MKIWKFALVSALIFTALWLLQPPQTASSQEKGVVEISYMGPSGPISGSMDDAIRVFERKSRVAHEADPSHPIYKVVSGQNASRDQTADPTRFLVSVAGGMPPDVIYFDRFAVSEWAARGAFMELGSLVQKDREAGLPDAINPDDFFPSCWQEAVYTDPLSGKKGLYGIPNSVDDRALFYNKDLLKRAGFVDARGEAKPPKTWEELEKMAVTLTEKDGLGRISRLGFIPNYGNSWLYLYGWMNGGEFMSADGKRCTLNSPPIVGALDWMTKIYDKLGGAREVYGFQSSFQGADLDPFITGKVGLKIDGFWILDSLSQFAKYLNFGVAPPPLPAKQLAAGKKPFSWVGGWCYAIPSTSKQPKAAWELIRFLSSMEAIKIMAESDRLNAARQNRPFIPSQHPNRKVNAWLAQNYIYDNPQVSSKMKEAVRVFNLLLPTARFRPVTMVGQLLWNQHIAAMENAIFHFNQPKEALDQANDLVQRQLDLNLHPPQGKAIPWGTFIWVYGLLVLALAALVFYWDTRRSLRTWTAAVARRLNLPAVALWVEGNGEEISQFWRWQWKGGWISASPWLLGFVVFTGGPILFSILISFSRYDLLNPATFVGWDNFIWMFKRDPLFWKSLGNTLFMALGIPLGMAASLAMAMLLNKEIKGISLWRTLFYLPAIMPAVASAILWLWILNPSQGLINSFLAQLGIHGPGWIGDESLSKPSLILMGLWGSGGGMIIWLAGLKNINRSYYEAASIDGASSWHQMIYITLPMLSPYILFNLIMGLIGTFQIFTQAFIMTNGGPVNSTLFYVYYLFNNAFRYLQMGYAAAMAWFLALIVFGLTLVQMRLSKKWVHYEGD